MSDDRLPESVERFIDSWNNGGYVTAVTAKDAARLAIEVANADLRLQIAEADRILVNWSHDFGWTTGHGDTLVDVLREVTRQATDATADLRRQLAEAQAAVDVDWQQAFHVARVEYQRKITTLEQRVAALERFVKIADAHVTEAETEFYEALAALPDKPGPS